MKLFKTCLFIAISILLPALVYCQEVQVSHSIVVGAEAIPVNGIITENLMYYNINNGSFRAGAVTNSPNWSIDSTGIYSTAFGQDTKAKGSMSLASGFGSYSYGSTSAAIGYRAEAWAERSFAQGSFTKAFGFASVALGSATESHGDHSTAIGRSSLAIGENSFSAGYNTDAGSFAGTAIGQYNIGIGNPDEWDSVDPVFEVGIGLSFAARANALTILKNGKISFSNYSFPINDGTSSQVLMTDGNGEINWQKATGLFHEDNGTVYNTGDLASDNFIFGSAAYPKNAVSSSDTAFMFLKEKGAFRAGAVTNSPNWAPDSTGIYSTAFGQDTKAKGSMSLASGFGSYSYGSTSAAIGYRAEAWAERSFAQGSFTKAFGFASVALGSATESHGDHSTAIGRSSLAIGENSFSAGYNTDAGSFAGTAIGQYNMGIGNPDVWDPVDPVFEVGIGLSIGTRKNALTVTKEGDVLFERHKAPLPGVVENGGGFFYHAAKNSIRIGNLPNLATTPDSLGLNSIGLGNLPRATGANSVAIGDQNTATRLGSFAGGKQSESHSSGGTALGFHAKTVSFGSTSVGSYNMGLGVGPSTLDWISTDPIFEVGIGQSDATRENAMTILKNGNVGIGNFAPEDELDIVGTAQIVRNSGSFSPQLRLQEVGDDWARLTFNNSTTNTSNYWTMAGRVHATDASSSFNVYYSDYGNVINAQGDGDVNIGERLGIGTGANTPSATLHAKSNPGDDALRIQVESATKMRVYSDGHVSLGGNYDNGSANDVIIVNQMGMGVTNPTFRLQIQNSATLSLGHARATAWTTYSDARVKTNIRNISYGLKEVLSLRPVAYDHHSSEFNENGLEVLDDHAQKIGFIAQEVYKIIEEVVQKPADEKVDLWSMDYEKLTPVLVKAIQELNDEKQTMQERLDSQQKMIDHLLNVTETLTSQVNEITQQSSPQSVQEGTK